MGHGGGAERLVGGSSPGMDKEANEETRSVMFEEKSASEWWAVLGTVADAFDGFAFVGFCFGKDAAGKCFFL